MTFSSTVVCSNCIYLWIYKNVWLHSSKSKYPLRIPLRIPTSILCPTQLTELRITMYWSHSHRRWLYRSAVAGSMHKANQGLSPLSSSFVQELIARMSCTDGANDSVPPFHSSPLMQLSAELWTVLFLANLFHILFHFRLIRNLAQASLLPPLVSFYLTLFFFLSLSPSLSLSLNKLSHSIYWCGCEMRE